MHLANGHRGRRLGALVAILGATLAISSPASARVINRERYEGTFSGDEFSCNHDLHFEGSYSGVFMLKTQGAEPTVGVLNNYESHEVLTLANGRGFRIDTNGNYKELRITKEQGTTYRYTATDSGSVFTISTLDGKAVERNVGLLVHTFLVDTLGDSDPDNDVFLEDSFEFVRSAGPHPELTSTDEEFCAAVDEAIAG